MDWLRKELGKISEDEIEAPDYELEVGDKVVGVLESLELKKIHELRRRVTYDGEKNLKEKFETIDLTEEKSGDHDPATCKRCELRREIELFKSKTDFLNQLFWTSVRHELSAEVFIESDKMQSRGVGIRQGWQIVLTKSENPISIEELLAVFRSV